MSLYLSEDIKTRKEETNKVSSKLIFNKVITLTSKTPSSYNSFESKFQNKFATSDQISEKQE